MKTFIAALSLLASVHGATAPAASQSDIEKYNLTLILEGSGADAVWRLTDENVPAHALLSRDTAAVDPMPLGKRWDRECHTSHGAPSDDCRTLTNSIHYSNAGIPKEPRNIVYHNCYISWSDVVSGVQDKLWAGAADTLADCGFFANGENEVSGIAHGYLGNNIAQCLSNRATRCA